jgi:23S rRNA (pseudouridine1915-N3)-methyltransferase
MKITVLAVGKARGADAELCAEYLKRLKGLVTVKEVSDDAALLKALPPSSQVVLLDERGKDLTSRELAAKLAGWQEDARDLTIVIGGADGHSEDMRKKAGFVLGFGRATWPHRLVRVMLLEQLYRAHQINAGHPYHRD